MLASAGDAIRQLAVLLGVGDRLNLNKVPGTPVKDVILQLLSATEQGEQFEILEYGKEDDRETVGLHDFWVRSLICSHIYSMDSNHFSSYF